MQARQRLPIAWLLSANVALVVLLFAGGNWWWLERLEHLGRDTEEAVTVSTESTQGLLDLLDRQLPLQQQLSKSTLITTRFIDELALLVLDAARDYTELKAIQAEHQAQFQEIAMVWPETMDRAMLNDFLSNMEIVGDIIDEVLDTSSPNQLQLLAEDSEETLGQLLAVMNSIERQLGSHLQQAESRNLEMNRTLQRDIAHLDSYVNLLKQQSLTFTLAIVFFILVVQLLLFRVLKIRLEGLGQVMREITSGGGLGKRVGDAQEGDLIGYLGLMFNRMLDRLESTQQDLLGEKERAEAATRAKSDFLANMSHEIRTPVHAVTSLVHLMREQTLTPKLASYVEKTEAAAEALLHVINDVLDFSKISEGKLELERKPFQLLPSLEKLVDLFNGKFNGKGLDFTLLVDPEVPNMLVGDRLRLNQILINLINNAFKFTSSGAVSLRVYCQPRQDGRIQLEFAVIDTGIGIDHRRIAALFNAFSQADSSTTRKYGGTGLGLAISKRLSELMEGDIQVTSAPDKGSIFTLQAVFERAQQPQVFIPPLPESVASQPVMLVCSRAAQRQMLEETLRGWQLAPTSVESLDQALGSLANAMSESTVTTTPLLLIDEPVADPGAIQESLRKISCHARLANVPVIFISNQTLGVETAREVWWVDRPTKPSDLFRAIVDALDIDELRVEKLDDASQRQKRRQRIQQRIVGARVLVVEDVLVNQQIAQEVLGRAGLFVALADNGQEALDRLQREPYDLVLMDLQMPVMGGLEATAKIRSLLQLTDLPIVAMTANVIKGAVEECLEAGCNDYLSKPLDMDQLWEVLGRWIEPAQRPPSLPAMAELGGMEGGDGAATPPLPNELPGIDLEIALERLGGNQPLYLSLLGDFLRQYGDSAEPIKALIGAGDLSGAERLAHAVKGAGANLGITDLSQVAQGLEHQLKLLLATEALVQPGLSPSFDQLLDDFSHHLQRSCMSIRLLLEQRGRQTSTEVVSDATEACADTIHDYREVLLGLDELAGLIRDSNADSLDRFEQLKPQLISAQRHGLVQDLESHLSCFAFDAAAEALASLSRQLDYQQRNSHG